MDYLHDVRECAGCEDPENAPHANDCPMNDKLEALAREEWAYTVPARETSGGKLGAHITELAKVAGVERSDIIAALFHLLVEAENSSEGVEVGRVVLMHHGTTGEVYAVAGLPALIESTTGPLGRGNYVHRCYRPAWCCEAGGVGAACGGDTTYTTTTTTTDKDLGQ